MVREDIVKVSGIENSGALTKVLEELVACVFVRKYVPFGRKKKNSVFQLIDNFTLFYFQFMERRPQEEHFWSKDISSSAKRAWCGVAYERVCLEHVAEIKHKLGISGVQTEVCSWYCRPNPELGVAGAQIDLLIVRRDQVINLCEMKFSEDNYTLTKKEEESLRGKIGAFRTVTGTKYSLHPTLVTTYGLNQGLYSGFFQSVVSAEDLFKKRD